MAIVDADGCESGAALMPNVYTGNLNVVTGRDGVGSAYATGGSDFARVVAPGSDEIYWHHGWHFSSTGGWNQPNSIKSLIYFSAAGTTHIVAYFNATGQLVVTRGFGGTVLATSTRSISTSAAWYSIEGHLIIHDTTGVIEMKVNGVTWISYTGDTRNGGSSTRVDLINFGINSAEGLYFDDWVLLDTTGGVNNTWPGELSIKGIRANGNGANSGLLGSDGNSVNNYLQVDEFPMSSTDYNGSATPGARDTYDMTTLTAVGQVLAVQNLAYVAKSDAGAKMFRHLQRGGSGGEVESADVPLSTQYLAYAGPVWLTDGDGNPWTVARVNAAEFGIEVQ